MFSLRARSRFVERGWSVASLWQFFRDSWSESLDDMGAHPRRVRAMWRFAVAFSLCATALIFLLPAAGGRVALVAWTVSAALLVTAWASLYVRLLEGAPPAGVGLPNYLTLLRFYLIAPVAFLLVDARYPAALAVYVALGATDVADGIVARRRGPVTSFGVVMDPLADVLSNAAVFAALTAAGVVPVWLLVILLVRYLMLIAGSFLFFLLVGPIEFRATLPGKIVGVLQAIGVSAIVVALALDPGVVAPMGRVLYPFLGLCFASIVVSQAVIGVRQRRRLREQATQAVDVGT
jgi:cardiolipin synthase